MEPDTEENVNEFSGDRDYSFPENDRLEGEITEKNHPDLQERYQQAFEAQAKTTSSSVAEDIAKYIRQ